MPMGLRILCASLGIVVQQGVAAGVVLDISAYPPFGTTVGTHRGAEAIDGFLAVQASLDKAGINVHVFATTTTLANAPVGEPHPATIGAGVLGNGQGGHIPFSLPPFVPCMKLKKSYRDKQYKEGQEGENPTNPDSHVPTPILSLPQQ